MQGWYKSCMIIVTPCRSDVSPLKYHMCLIESHNLSSGLSPVTHAGLVQDPHGGRLIINV